MSRNAIFTSAVVALLLLSFLPNAAATLDTGKLGKRFDGFGFGGCSVDIGDGNKTESCPFDCKAGEEVFVSAAASDGAVGATASCGGSSSCSAPPDCENSHTSGGTLTGTCTISVVDGNGHEDKGSASCWTECDSEECEDPEPTKCIGPYVGGKCLEDYITTNKPRPDLCSIINAVNCEGAITQIAPHPTTPLTVDFDGPSSSDANDPMNIEETLFLP